MCSVLHINIVTTSSTETTTLIPFFIVSNNSRYSCGFWPILTNNLSLSLETKQKAMGCCPHRPLIEYDFILHNVLCSPSMHLTYSFAGYNPHSILPYPSVYAAQAIKHPTRTCLISAYAPVLYPLPSTRLFVSSSYNPV